MCRWQLLDTAGYGTCYLFGCVRESEGRRKLRIAARSPALTMRCGCRTGVGRWECAESCPLRGLDDAACLLVSAEGWIAMTKIIWHYLEAPAATRRRVNRRRQKAWCVANQVFWGGMWQVPSARTIERGGGRFRLSVFCVPRAVNTVFKAKKKSYSPYALIAKWSIQVY